MMRNYIKELQINPKIHNSISYSNNNVNNTNMVSIRVSSIHRNNNRSIGKNNGRNKNNTNIISSKLKTQKNINTNKNKDLM